jgi:hypothetical protein
VSRLSFLCTTTPSCIKRNGLVKQMIRGRVNDLYILISWCVLG